MGKPKNREEYRQYLAEQFINVLEDEQLSWKKNWTVIKHKNGITKNDYKGVNVLTLSLAAMHFGYSDPRWVTMVQIMDKQGKYHPGEKWHLKKGSKASYVEYWFPFDLKKKKALTWEEYRIETKKEGRSLKEFSLYPKYTAVFNASCIEGIPELKKEPGIKVEHDAIIDKLSKNMNVPINYDGINSAYYASMLDSIHLPKKESFKSSYDFYATALHEIAHATGHSSRLDRKLGGGFGSVDYAYEELIAEMSACFMSTELKVEQTLEHVDNHKAYIQSWIKAIKEDPNVLIKAVRDAQNCANYMDFKSELISEQEYLKTLSESFEVSKESITSVKGLSEANKDDFKSKRSLNGVNDLDKKCKALDSFKLREKSKDILKEKSVTLLDKEKEGRRDKCQVFK